MFWKQLILILQIRFHLLSEHLDGQQEVFMFIIRTEGDSELAVWRRYECLRKLSIRFRVAMGFA